MSIFHFSLVIIHFRFFQAPVDTEGMHPFMNNSGIHVRLLSDSLSWFNGFACQNFSQHCDFKGVHNSCWATSFRFLHLVSLYGPRNSQIMDSLESILGDAGVDPALTASLLSDGWGLGSFRDIVSSISEFTDDLFEELSPNQPLTLLQKASIRSAWRGLQQSGAESSQSGAASASAPLAAAAEGSWSESFPPKLTSATVAALKGKFQTNYPSEVLTPDTQPSARLLALAHQLHVKKEYKWLPWKYRMSLSRAEELSMHRQTKAPRLEQVQLHQLLVDEVPSLEINNQVLGLNAVSRMFDIQNYAWAMVQACHLHRLRAYSLKFMSFLSTRMDSESGLRPPTILAQQADKHLWHLVSELCESPEWSLDEALLEFTQNRGDMAALLQPRPKVAKPLPPATPPQKGLRPSKGGGKTSKSSKGSGKPSVRWISEIWKGSQKKTLCMRYQMGRCSNKDCRFEHACGYPKSDGTACGGPHPASEHEKTPH